MGARGMSMDKKIGLADSFLIAYSRRLKFFAGVALASFYGSAIVAKRGTANGK
jgi:hypothetical protein